MKRQLGSTGAGVNAIGLGTWQLSNPGRPSFEDAIAVIRRAVEGGVDFVDTADCYALDDSEFGYSEHLVKAALDGVPGHAVRVATKAGFRRPGGVWAADAHPESIKRCCDESLDRLGSESIFLYQLHGVDEKVPFEDSVGALAELKDQGKVVHLGLSNVSREQLASAQAMTRIESVQNACNPWMQSDVASGLIAECERTGVAYLPFFPVGGKEMHRTLASQSTLAPLAEKYQTSTYCLLLNWLLRLGPHVLPIPGASRAASILDSLRAGDFELDHEDFVKLGALTPPDAAEPS